MRSLLAATMLLETVVATESFTILRNQSNKYIATWLISEAYDLFYILYYCKIFIAVCRLVSLGLHAVLLSSVINRQQFYFTFCNITTVFLFYFFKHKS